MKIINPYKQLEHRVYKRTFLQDVQVEFDFDLCKDAFADRQRIQNFFLQYFHVTPGQDAPSSFSTIELCDADKLIRFRFTEEKTVVTVSPQAYESFVKTMIPFIDRQLAYMEKICSVSSARKMIVRKRNVWEVRANDNVSIKDIYSSALRYTFNEHHVGDMFSIMLPNESSCKISKDADVDLGDGTLKVILSAEIKDNQKADFVLEFIATADNVPVMEVLEVATGLNEVVYCAFHDIVSKDVINLMEQDGED